jgi:hypothetical protein
VCGRVVGASVAEFTAAASPALSDPRAVLMIDAFERCVELEGWLHQNFLPQLPDGVITVLASQHRPEQAWCADPAWSGTLLVRSLGDLTRPEADQLLASRGVPVAARESVLPFAGGHPLALAAAAETARRCVPVEQLECSADEVLQSLLTALIETAPSPDHRTALYVCAHAERTTEPLLRGVLSRNHNPQVDPAELLAWLRMQPIMMSEPDGLYPHGAVREMLANYLRSRDPAADEAVHRSVSELARLVSRPSASATTEAARHPARPISSSPARRSA